MLHRGFALLAVFALSPAHAALIEYSFTAQIQHGVSAFGLVGGDIITGGFLFDDAAPTISYSESLIDVTDYGLPPPPYLATTSTYDMGNLLWWVRIGDHDFSAVGDELQIVDVPLGHPFFLDRWGLGMRGDGSEVNGYTVQSMSIFFMTWSGAMASSELRVAEAGWTNFPPWDYSISFMDGSSIHSRFQSITSVPEPGTLALLLGGGMLLSVFRRRNA